MSFITFVFSERSKRSKPRLITRKRQQTPDKSGSSERDSSPANKCGSKSPSRGRSGRKTSQSSTGKKSDLRARYWSYLFDNLKRAVDEIYSTCETDESTVECEVSIFFLINLVMEPWSTRAKCPRLGLDLNL